MVDLPPVDPIPDPLKAQQGMLLLAVGICLMAWAQVEYTLHEIFVNHVIRQSRNKQRYVVARGVWSAVISFEARLRMIDAAIKGNLYKMEAKRFRVVTGDWRLLYNYTIKMSSLRNEIAHGTMVNCDDKGMMITPYATTIPFRPGIPIEELQSRTRLFNELNLALTWHDLSFASLWKRQLKKHVLDHKPVPDLVLRLRKQKQDQNRDARTRKQKKRLRGKSRRRSEVSRER
jgi:hypothetical protein